METHNRIYAHTGAAPLPPTPVFSTLDPLCTPLEHTALPEKEEPVFLRWVIIQPLGEARMGPFCPL